MKNLNKAKKTSNKIQNGHKIGDISNNAFTSTPNNFSKTFSSFSVGMSFTRAY